jgi:rhodanese-related sulfurtransferase
MRIIFLSLTITIVLLGCKTETPAPTETSTPTSVEAAPAETAAGEPAPTEISVEDADAALKAGAMAFDANSDRTRAEYGTVPDAVILTSSSKYELSQLPEDKAKDLIFYCSNTRCTASDAAAERASAHGYKNVHIMRAGIKGWKEAGKPTTPFSS